MQDQCRNPDHGNGSGTLTWQTDNECAGDYFTVFQVEDRAGEVDWWTIRFIVGDVNRRVVLDRNLPDTTFAEDTVEQLICRLGDYFSDPDGEVGAAPDYVGHEEVEQPGK